MTCCDFRDAADRQFTAEKAAKELEAYRKGRLGPTTRLLRDGVLELGLSDGSLLDIGGGVGALAFELLERGVTKAVVVDASAAYVAATREEANRRGRMESVAVVHGDLLQLSAQLPAADLVTLDRVVCCYPAYKPMLEEAMRHALRALAVSYPRDRWYVRLALWLENVKRARGSGFRTFVHPPARIQEIIKRSGFTLVRRRFTIMWTIDVFKRRSGSA
jgi:magnesium-protoporphyrin O-methyltransferase